jgi:hypothetical protein
VIRFEIAFTARLISFFGMLSTSLFRPLLAAVCSALLVPSVFAADTGPATAVSPREHLSLDANWKFHLGDDWPNALRLDKAGVRWICRMIGPSN